MCLLPFVVSLLPVVDVSHLIQFVSHEGWYLQWTCHQRYCCPFGINGFVCVVVQTLCVMMVSFFFSFLLNGCHS